MKNTILLALLSYANITIAQTILVNPYLQDAEPHSIYILWETDGNEESIVEWGLTQDLGNETTGIAYPSDGDARIHEVQIADLERFTRYYYRVRTGEAVSEIYDFKTPPFESDGEPFRIVAMSDMQRDGSFPDKFQEIVEEGVLDYLEAELGGELVDNLALVMVPGDLVVNGNNYGSWKQEFFDPSQQLISRVPVYPVLGNHENNSQFYFTYFKMPENGTAGFEEHWWHKDYGNVRIIGLNSNGSFAGGEQLEWLDNTLATTCEADSIDFVFAELHHPHKSELWTPGESNFTGEVIERLEQFTTNCGKPSIHFFGHTHGYSRGQSRDHKHLWINVATAGGAIDNWGEFPNFDYDEFSVSQDEYGFVLVEITNDDAPKLVIKRISRGDQDEVIDNALTDSLVIRLMPSEVVIPTPIFPVDVTIAPECVTLKASDFADESLAEHGQSHWQITTLDDGFNNSVAESWKNFENWYYDIDTQAGDDLADEEFTGLQANTDYIWRVRYRDKEMNWSDWSEVVSFSTSESLISPNLLLNPGSENQLVNWEMIEGVVESVTNGECNGIAPHSGERYFAVGGLCEHSEVGIAAQMVDISAFADSIDVGAYAANFGGYLSNFSGSDLPEIRIQFFDENGAFFGESDYHSTLNSTWTWINTWAFIPPQTRQIRMELKGTRNNGTDNDSYFDDLFLRVGSNEIDCSGVSSVQTPFIAKLSLSPNPMQTETVIAIPKHLTGKVSAHLVDMQGNKVFPPQRRMGDKLQIKRGHLAAGTYLIWLRNERGVIGVGKLIVT